MRTAPIPLRPDHEAFSDIVGFLPALAVIATTTSSRPRKLTSVLPVEVGRRLEKVAVVRNQTVVGIDDDVAHAPPNPANAE